MTRSVWRKFAIVIVCLILLLYRAYRRRTVANFKLTLTINVRINLLLGLVLSIYFYLFITNGLQSHHCTPFDQSVFVCCSSVCGVGWLLVRVNNTSKLQNHEKNEKKSVYRSAHAENKHLSAERVFVFVSDSLHTQYFVFWPDSPSVRRVHFVTRNSANESFSAFEMYLFHRRWLLD